MESTKIMSDLGYLLLRFLRLAVWLCAGFLTFFLGYFLWLKISAYGGLSSWSTADYTMLGLVSIITLATCLMARSMGQELKRYKR